MRFVLYLLTLVSIMSCGRGYETKELYVQEISQSSKKIYQFAAWSTLNDGAKYGFAILDSNEVFDISSVEQMPFRVFAKLPNKDSIYIITSKSEGSHFLKHISTTYANYKGFIVKNDCHDYSGSPTNLEYRFSTFRETKDSLFLYGLEKVYFNLPNSSSEIGFRKGNIKLAESDSLTGILQSIQIFAYVIDSVYAKSFREQVIIRDSNLSVDGLVEFKFLPTKKFEIKEFSNNGIYKKIKICFDGNKRKAIL